MLPEKSTPEISQGLRQHGKHCLTSALSSSPPASTTSLLPEDAFYNWELELLIGSISTSRQCCWPLSRWAVQADCARISASSTKIPPQPPRSSKWHWVLPICCKTPGLLLSQRTDRQSCWLSSGCLSSLTVRRVKQSFSAQISYPDSKSFSLKTPETSLWKIIFLVAGGRDGQQQQHEGKNNSDKFPETRNLCFSLPLHH